MSAFAAVLILLGSVINVIAGIGLVRFDSPYARFHAAGKAAPVGFLVIAVGASIEMGAAASLHLAVAAAGLVLTLPVGVHLLYRAVHRTHDGDELVVDELIDAEIAAGRRSPRPS